MKGKNEKSIDERQTISFYFIGNLIACQLD